VITPGRIALYFAINSIALLAAYYAASEHLSLVILAMANLSISLFIWAAILKGRKK